MAETANPPAAIRSPGPGLPLVLFLGLLAGLLLFPENPVLRDLDVGWLVKTGELILANGKLPQSDVFSFSSPGQPWVLYQWGFELYLGTLHRLAGLGGVVWGTALLIALAYTALFTYLLRQGLPRLQCLGLLLLTMLVNNFHWYSRPATFSVLAYVVLLLLLEGYRTAPRRQFWFLPLLFLVWANFHLAFVWGLAVLGIYGLWAWWAPHAFRGAGARRDPWLLLMLPLCLGAAILTPYGWDLFAYPWNLSQSSSMNAGIIELQSPNFHQPASLFFMAQLVLVLLFSGHKYPGRPVLLTVMVMALCLGLYSVRHLPLFSIPATLHLAYSLRERAGWPAAAAAPCWRRRNLAIAALGALLTLAWVSGIAHWRPGFYDFESSRVPREAAAYLSRQTGDRPLRVFLWSCDWSSYLIYAASPGVQVFMDTRFDMYGEEAFQKFEVLTLKAIDHPDVLDPWQVDFLLLKKPKEAEMFRPGPHWQVAYEDKQAVVYRPRLSEE